MAELTQQLPQNDSERAMVYGLMRNLSKHPGWKFLCTLIDQNIKVYEDFILDPHTDEEDKAKIDEYKLQRYDLVTFKKWPDELMKTLKPDIPKEEIEYDPYG